MKNLKDKKRLLSICPPQKKSDAVSVKNLVEVTEETKRKNSRKRALKAWVTIRKNKKAIAKAKAIKEKKPAFTNYNGIEKQITRDMFAFLIAKSGKHSGNVGGLSAGECRSEITINKQIPNNSFVYLGFELELDTCRNMQNTIIREKLNMFAIPLSISVAIMTAEKDSYSHFNLDFCVNFSSIMDDLEMFFSRDIVAVGGITQITIGMRYSKSKFVDTFGDKDCKKDKNLNAFRNFISKFPNYKIVACKSYKEKKTNEENTTMGMLTIFVERIK